MKRIVNERSMFVVALGAAALTVGVVAGTYRSHAGQAARFATPVKYTKQTAPPVTPEEAVRVTASAKDLSTAFRVASDKVLPAVVTIETARPQTDTSERRIEPRQGDPFGGRNPLEGTPFEEFFPRRAVRQEFPV